MAEEGVRRKLAAILAADVVGYSRLMGADDEGTLRALHSVREIVERRVRQHEGQPFGLMADSMMGEFMSPVEAVRCAAEIQAELEEWNAEVPEERRMRLRIGINLGDVMVEGENLFGDGVNIAARLQELAPAGGICISDSVYQQIRNRVSLGFEQMGEHAVKNIAEPVVVYRFLTAPEAAGQLIGV